MISQQDQQTVQRLAARIAADQPHEQETRVYVSWRWQWTTSDGLAADLLAAFQDLPNASLISISDVVLNGDSQHAAVLITSDRVE
jgi:hypothetical protein